MAKKGAHFTRWEPEKAVGASLGNLSKALGKFGLIAEGYAKKELVKGHGVLTGTLRRSIHTAQPGYDWAGDNVPASNASPERGMNMALGQVANQRLVLQFGSGLIYALAIHNGFGGFPGYHYLTLGLDKAKPELPGVIEEFKNG